ncbi:methyl-accepting chemotaxis (MCP) signaling domain protein [Paraburkholderia xenovorans LB400]|uniref:Methyl-accepting chemotaxis sensory transducer n=1 Tax=Paraburkholderia xenovorans (strain LB400) TaxID=266265 RepID=Q13HC9_PARXL|nr:methyl-accepting chemotaxis protein [Paraburkholderia xenovorans]ABE36510.1 methyl-accepting chemotaxis sensory transducer [Paraburkholderia xenovorans LB400]AIP34622.1 methyl-accepting chemotaxis (MCP) signaling domain protein [Paraburkholderia xenovorans LB400]
MLKNLSIRSRLAVFAAIFVVLMLMVIAIASGTLKLTNGTLRDAQRSSAAMMSLKSSAEQLLRVRVELGGYETETLFGAGKSTEGLLQRAHQMLIESNDEFRAYANGPFHSEDEARLARAAAQARTAFVEHVLEPEHKALVDNDFNTFRSIEGEGAARYYAAYTKTIDELEQYQTQVQQRDTDTATARFHYSLVVFAVLAALGVLMALAASRRVTAAIVNPVDQAIRHFESIAAGDLTIDVRVRSRDELGRLLTALMQMREGLSNTVSRVRGSTDAIALGANEIAAGNADLSSRTSQQAAALEETAASLEELSAMVRQNTASAKQANHFAQGAFDTVTRGADFVTRVTETMSEISTSSRKVAEITGIIEGIAFQTNILALNAAVEAARAGEQGRGFAVVASEVRSLAQRSGTAAKEIKDLIAESGASVEQGTMLVHDARRTMEEAREAVGRVTGIMGEIEAAALEQSDGIEQVNKSIAQIDKVTQRNAALVEEAAAAANSLEEQADVLRNAVAVFRTGGDAGAQHGSAAYLAGSVEPALS